MIELNIWADFIADKLELPYPDYKIRLTDFLEDNDWFGIETIWKDGALYIHKTDADMIFPKIETYFRYFGLNDIDKVTLLADMYKERFPDSAPKLLKFVDEFSVPDILVYHLLDFLLIYQKKDLCIMTDNDVKELMKSTYEELSKQLGDILTFFLSWLKDNYKTKYINDYIMQKRYENSTATRAYDRDEYLELVYYLFNAEYIFDNDMYEKAAKSKNYADTWLFLSLHFICSLRNTDLIRIYHPKLTMAPEKIIENIINNRFPEKDARLTLYSITWHLNSLPLQPSKTLSHTGISSIKFCVPESAEVHIGTLFAICEAHRLIAGISDDMPFIRCISDYDRITRYMGEEIGSLFLEANFRSRSVNKSYMQAFDMFSDDILGNNGFHMKGYILAALARSHKGSYGEFARTTAAYLKDANFSGLTPEFVAMELFERGVLSFIPSMLLKMITGTGYDKLTVHKQTELIQILDMTPNEVEEIVKLSEISRITAKDTLMKVMGAGTNKREELLQILHNIGNGSAVSKQSECLCLVTALHKLCPYAERRQCIGCEYEISTKATVFLLVSEYNRMLKLYENSKDNLTRQKYKALLKEQILPSLDEIIQCTGEQYGDAAQEMLEKIIRENTL